MRPEPITALFVTGVAACMVRFLTRESAAPIALASALTALALTAHPAGVVSLAAVIVAVPRVFAWARSHLALAVTIVSASSALLATLAFVGSDLDQRVADADTTQETSVPGRDELQRYAYLWEEPFGTPLRRGLRRPHPADRPRVRAAAAARSPRPLDFPAMTLGVGLVLLVATPSKWPSHFGALVGIGALAMAAEAARLRSDGRHSRPRGMPGPCWRSAPPSWPRPGRGGSAMRGTRSICEPSTGRRAPLAWRSSPCSHRFSCSRSRWWSPMPEGAGNGLHRVPWRVASWIPAAIAVPRSSSRSASSSPTRPRRAPGPSFARTSRALQANRAAGSQTMCSSPSELPRGPSRSSEVETCDRRPMGPAESRAGASARSPSAPGREAPAYSPWFELPPDRRGGIFVSGTPGALGHALDRVGSTHRRDGRVARDRRDHRGRERAVRQRTVALLLRRRSPGSSARCHSGSDRVPAELRSGRCAGDHITRDLRQRAPCRADGAASRPERSSIPSSTCTSRARSLLHSETGASRYRSTS